MNPAPTSPKPAGPTDRRQEPSAMKSALKILLPLGLLLVVVFVLTMFSLHTPTEVGDKQGKADPVATGKKLVFFTTMRKWDPGLGSLEPDSKISLQDVAFPGFFEPGETTHATQFWFENRNPGKVTLRLVGVSCTSCSGGRVAAVPPDAARALLQMAAVAALPGGPVGGCPPGMAGAGAVLTSRLEWEAHSFKDGSVDYTLPPPAGGDPWAPAWGILELNFKVRPNPSTPLHAAFVTLDEGGAVVAPGDRFSIDFAAAQPVEVDKSAIEVGELADNTPGQTHVVTAYSSTRTAAEMPELSARVVNPAGGDPGPFVTAGRPEPVPAGELDRLAAALSAKANRPVRVLSAFRLPVTVVARAGDARPDIGRLEREVWVGAGLTGGDPRKVVVRATVAGPVALAGGATEINLGSFKHQAGAAETVVLTTDRPEAALELVPGAARPEFLDVTLKKLPDAAGRGQWQLTIRVPPGRLQGELTDGMVVLELKGPNPQRIRIPVRGRGVL